MRASIPAAAPPLLATACLCLLVAGGCAKPPAKKSGRIERESGVLLVEPGHRGDRLGVEVERVVDTDDGKYQAIDLRVPVDADMVDEVEVIGPGGRRIELGDEPQILPEADERGVGLRLFVPKKKNLEFRLRLIDLPEN